MFRKILVPVDLTEKNAGALASASAIARGGEAEVALLHVVETIEDVPFQEMSEFYLRLEQRAEAAMDPIAERLRAEGVAAVRRIAFGRRAPEIVRFAADWGSDLIVLSSHRIDPADPGANWGTISYRVAILAQCPVLLVK